MRHDQLIELFRTHMLSQLLANDHRNGGDEQYRPHKDINTHDVVGIAALLKELAVDVAEFEKLVYGEGQAEWAEEQRIALLAAAADVANMAMLICYDVGALRGPRVEQPEKALTAADVCTCTRPAGELHDFGCPGRLSTAPWYGQTSEERSIQLNGVPTYKGRLVCARAPLGWQCTRDPNHDGPCAVIEVTVLP